MKRINCLMQISRCILVISVRYQCSSQKDKQWQEKEERKKKRPHNRNITKWCERIIELGAISAKNTHKIEWMRWTEKKKRANDRRCVTIIKISLWIYFHLNARILHAICDATDSEWVNEIVINRRRAKKIYAHWEWVS